jgi:hypothetical protein
MLKLLNRWMLAPTLTNARKLRSYARRHAMAVCMLTTTDQKLLAFALYQAERQLP